MIVFGLNGTLFSFEFHAHRKDHEKALHNAIKDSASSHWTAPESNLSTPPAFNYTSSYASTQSSLAAPGQCDSKSAAQTLP